jgi:hypothetical protein
MFSAKLGFARRAKRRLRVVFISVTQEARGALELLYLPEYKERFLFKFSFLEK